MQDDKSIIQVIQFRFESWVIIDECCGWRFRGGGLAGLEQTAFTEAENRDGINAAGLI